MQCKARYCREKRELPFALRSGYFTELRCSNLSAGAGDDPELCEKCQMKAAKPFRIACQQGQYQGKIDEPYFDGSWIFGSERFKKYNAIPGNAISEELWARAEAAQKIARQGSEMKEKAEPKRKPSAASKALATTTTATKEPPVKKTKVSNKVVVPNTISLPVGIELLDEPLEAAEVTKIKVKPLTIDKTTYWLDEKTGVMYETGKQNSVGKKVGVWNPDEETIE
jgi:hypothetical protein